MTANDIAQPRRTNDGSRITREMEQRFDEIEEIQRKTMSEEKQTERQSWNPTQRRHYPTPGERSEERAERSGSDKHETPGK